jgi:hypothetical protein
MTTIAIGHRYAAGTRPLPNTPGLEDIRAGWRTGTPTRREAADVAVGCGGLEVGSSYATSLCTGLAGACSPSTTIVMVSSESSRRTRVMGKTRRRAAWAGAFTTSISPTSSW